MKRFSAIPLLSILLITTIGYPADTNVVSVTAVVLSKSECKFNSKKASLNFGNLDPANPMDKTEATSIVFRCAGKGDTITFTIIDDDGLYETGLNGNRMRHTVTPTEYLPYSLTLSPISGTIPKNTNETLTITGTVRVPDYQDALAGSYSDTVTLTIVPKNSVEKRNLFWYLQTQ